MFGGWQWAASLGGALLLCSAEQPKSLKVIAEHRVCCDQNGIPLKFPRPSNDPLKEWSLILSQLKAGACIHTFGSMVKLPGGEKIQFFNRNHYVAKTTARGRGSSGRLECAQIQLTSRDAGFLASEDRFFDARNIVYWTQRRPNITITTGHAEIRNSFEDAEFVRGGWRTHSPQEYMNIGREVIGDDSGFTRIITRERLEFAIPDEIFSGRTSEVVAFLEHATSSRVPSWNEARAFIFKDQLNGLITEDQLRLLNVNKALDSLQRQVGDLRKVPRRLLLLKAPDVDDIDEDNPGRCLQRRSTSGSRRRRTSNTDEDLVDLSLLAQHVSWITKLTDGSTTCAAAGFNMWRAFNTSHSAEHVGFHRGEYVTGEQIMTFLMISGPLASSKTSYAEVRDFLKNVAVRHIRTDSAFPILSVCGQKLERHGGGNLLSRHFHFTAVGPTRVVYGFRSLSSVGGTQDRDCVALALPEVPEEELKTLTRQPLNVLLALIAHPSESDEKQIRTTETANVDIWKFFGGKNEPIGKLFAKIAVKIEGTDAWPTRIAVEAKDGSRSKSRRRSLAGEVR